MLKNSGMGYWSGYRPFDIQENTDRLMALSEYVKGEATVKFKVGSANISPEDEEKLKQLAAACDLFVLTLDMLSCLLVLFVQHLANRSRPQGIHRRGKGLMLTPPEALP